MQKKYVIQCSSSCLGCCLRKGVLLNVIYCDLCSLLHLIYSSHHQIKLSMFNKVASSPLILQWFNEVKLKLDDLSFGNHSAHSHYITLLKGFKSSKWTGLMKGYSLSLWKGFFHWSFLPWCSPQTRCPLEWKKKNVSKHPGRILINTSVNCLGVSCSVLEICAVEMAAFSPIIPCILPFWAVIRQYYDCSVVESK